MSIHAAAAVFILLLSAVPAQAQESKVTNSLIAAASAAAFFDTAGSIACQAQGVCREINPVYTSHPLGFAAVKGAGNSAVVYLLIRQRKTHPKLVRAIAVGYAGLNVYLGIRAARTIQ